jgi:hypothetical protein
MVQRLILVSGQYPLIEAFYWREGGPITQQDIEESQSLDIAAQHDDAQSERHRENEANGSPHPAPEDCRHNYRKRRETGTVAVKDGLDRLADKHFTADIKTACPDHHRPAGVDRHRERQRKRGGDKGPDVGDEAQQARQDPPQKRVGQSNEIKTNADKNAKRGVDRELGQKIFAETAGGIVHCNCGFMQIGRAKQPDQPVAQILFLQENENSNDDNNAHRRERREDGSQITLDELQR